MVQKIHRLRPESHRYERPQPEKSRPGARPGVGVSTPRGNLVAALNLSPQPGDVEGNLRLAERAVSEAKRRQPGLRWVVLPELFTTGYASLASVHRHAETADGTSARRFTALARELGVYIAYGFPERLPGREGPFGIYDSASLVGPEGVLMTYRKMHLVRESAERHVFAPGADLPIVTAGGVRVAIVICWDLGFPEVVRGAAAGGAELILAPAGWRTPYGHQYDLSCAARALDNAVYLASANQLGEYPDARFDAPGGVYGPDGSRSPDLGRGRLLRRSSVLKVEPGAPSLWKDSYGCTLFYGEPYAAPDLG